MKLSLFFLSIVLLGSESSQAALSSSIFENAIRGGQDARDSDAVAKSTVLVGYHCSGTLIEEDVVLTAAHCLENPGENRSVTFLNGDRYAVAGMRANPSWRGGPDGDIAVLVLRNKVSEKQHPAALLSDSKLLTRGRTVVLAGWGVSNPSRRGGGGFEDGGEPGDGDILEGPEGDGELIEGPEGDGGPEDGDMGDEEGFRAYRRVDVQPDGFGRLRSTSVKIAQVHRASVQTNEESGRGSCSGDSGGSAFVEVDGQLQLWGVVSGGDRNCQHVGLYARIEAFQDWIGRTAQDLRRRNGSRR